MHDSILLAILALFDRLIEEARQAIRDKRINVFHLQQLNSFQPGRLYRYPLLIEMKEATYRRYKNVWKSLLCYVYRVGFLGKAPLHFKLTDNQKASFKALVFAVRRNPTAPLQLCLDFCLSLLDQHLGGDVYDSIVIGFLAVLAIDPVQQQLRGPSTYTSFLSGLVKCSALLIVQQAVGAQDPTEVIVDLHTRLIAAGNYSPMNWLSNLRLYGAKVRDSAAGVGILTWGDDGETVTLKGTKLSVTQLRGFVQRQVVIAREIMRELIFLEDGEAAPPLNLHEIVDNHGETRAGWSFLEHPRNTQLSKNWLFKRVGSSPLLQQRFCRKSGLDIGKVKAYRKGVKGLLEHLMVLIHLTGGQPARAPELLTLQWRNGNYGSQRSIYIDDGLVNIVTVYHKGYSVDSTLNSTKIINRFLPTEVSELLVYYLWLVQPFVRKVEKAGLGIVSGETLLWAKDQWDETKIEETWDPKRLTEVLTAEFQVRISAYGMRPDRIEALAGVPIRNSS